MRGIIILLVSLSVLVGCNERPEPSDYDPDSVAANMEKSEDTIAVEPDDDLTSKYFRFSTVNLQVRRREDETPISMSADTNIHLRKRDWEIKYWKDGKVVHSVIRKSKEGNVNFFLDLTELCDSGVLSEVPDRITVRWIED